MPEQAWDIWVDTGGTFTDALARSPQGELLRAKVLSSGRLRGRATGPLNSAGNVLPIEHRWGAWAQVPDAAAGWHIAALGARNSEVKVLRSSASLLHLAGPLPVVPGEVFELISEDEAPVLAARLLTGTAARGTLPPIRLRLATTRGTNALLTGATARCALFINRGLEDLLEIGTQQRPDLFALDIRKPALLAARTIGIAGRLDAAGREIEPLDLDALRRAAAELVREGFRDAAVAFLHSDLNSAHEDSAAECLREAGMSRVSCSARLAPFIKILPRTTTAVVNACLAPVIDDYLARVRGAFTAPGSSLLVMSSSGGLAPAGAFAAKDSLLSGPAAGVVGAARAAESAGFAHAVSFDMGGTSTDAARWTRDSGCEMVFEHTVGHATLIAPAVGVETVAAGGGSVCTFRDGALAVGPESAGANPGPACYGAGGPLTLTDVNLLLGRLCPDRMAIPIDLPAAERALERVQQDALAATGRHWPREQLLEGFLDIAAERMAGAVQRISTRRGHALQDAVLVAFGGAGGQHACAVAARLGVEAALAPVDAGLLSAVGLGAAAVERFAERQVLAPLVACASKIEGWLRELGDRARTDAAAAADVPNAHIRRRIAALRLVGQEAPIEIDLGEAEAPDLPARFINAHTSVYGYAPEERPIELVWLRVLAAATHQPRLAVAATVQALAAARRSQRVCFGGTWFDALVLDREALAAGAMVDGPAIIAEDHATVVVEPGWSAGVADDGGLVLRQIRGSAATATRGVSGAITVDPATLELFTARFESLAREMGEALARTSVSVNVKERLDFSCAVLDNSGRLVACAPHVPVHLGSLGVCVRAVREAMPMNPGDSVITNHPAFGGSHLPDITIITPAHDGVGALIGYVASRAHHAEVGGTRPGSMPPDARTLEDEGVIIAPFKIVEAGVPRLDRLERVLAEAPHPSRNIQDNLADVRAALAANAQGVARLRALAAMHGAAVVGRFMEAIQDRSARLLVARLSELPRGEMHAADAMDDGSPIVVKLTNDGESLAMDFSGSALVHPGNLNATPAIVSSCIVYVLRVLLDRPVPLNEGLMRPVRLILPEGMLNPRFDGARGRLPAVVGGNVETSQRVVDVLLRALGLCASSQGTMNNFVFAEAREAGGDSPRGAAAPSYYETICGGAGAGPGFDGASAVHTHMTNTRITDPEILERRYPVRLERFAVRRGSGGAGVRRGGDGIERAVRFLAPARVSLLTQRRLTAPPGLAGGRDAVRGEQTLRSADGSTVALPGCASFDAAIGDVLTIRTPGGGGWGAQQ